MSALNSCCPSSKRARTRVKSIAQSLRWSTPRLDVNVEHLVLHIGIGLRAGELVDFSLVYQVPYLRLDLLVPLSLVAVVAVQVLSAGVRGEGINRQAAKQAKQADARRRRARSAQAHARRANPDTQSIAQNAIGCLDPLPSAAAAGWREPGKQADARRTRRRRARARSAGKPGKQAHTAQARKLTFVLCSVECWKRFLRSWIMPPQFLESHDACPRLFCLSE